MARVLSLCSGCRGGGGGGLGGIGRTVRLRAAPERRPLSSPRVPGRRLCEQKVARASGRGLAPFWVFLGLGEDTRENTNSVLFCMHQVLKIFCRSCINHYSLHEYWFQSKVENYGLAKSSKYFCVKCYPDFIHVMI